MKMIDQHHVDIMDLKNTVSLFVAKSQGDAMAIEYLERCVESLQEQLTEVRNQLGELEEVSA